MRDLTEHAPLPEPPDDYVLSSTRDEHLAIIADLREENESLIQENEVLLKGIEKAAKERSTVDAGFDRLRAECLDEINSYIDRAKVDLQTVLFSIERKYRAHNCEGCLLTRKKLIDLQDRIDELLAEGCVILEPKVLGLQEQVDELLADSDRAV